MGIDAIPLRTQSDRRLVRLVGEGYESAFEEIVRRYRRPLDRFAASIVGGRSEDVTQDAFRKALVALRREEGEIELRPWLYRIVRNTALNDLRDRPPAAAELAEDLLAGGRSAAAEAEARAEVASLTARLRALPENQRAALVMRELEGRSHEEIAAALGISGGGARQAIARGRAAVRAGFGVFVPLPLLRALASGGDPATEAAVGAGGAGVMAGGAGAALLGGGAGALKVGLATIVVAGGIGAGVAIEHHGDGGRSSDPPKAVADAPASTPGGPKADRVETSPSPVAPAPTIAAFGDDHHRERHEGHRRHHESGSDDGSRVERAVAAEPTVVDDPAPAPAVKSGGGPGPSPESGSGGGPGPSHPSGGHDSSGRGGDDHSGHGSGSGDDGTSRSGSGSGSSESSSGGQGTSGGYGSSGGHGSDDTPPEVVAEAPPVEVTSSGGPGPSSSGGDGSGSPGGPSPTLDESGSSGGSDTSGGHGSDDDSEISP